MPRHKCCFITAELVYRKSSLGWALCTRASDAVLQYVFVVPSPVRIRIKPKIHVSSHKKKYSLGVVLKGW